MRKSTSRLAVLAAASFTLLAGVTCTDSSLTGPGKGLRSVIGLAPAFSRAAAEIFRGLAAFQVAIDNLRIVLRHPDGSVAVDTVVAVPAGTETIAVELVVPLKAPEELLEARIDLRSGTEVLFSGVQQVRAKQGTTSERPPAIPIEYVGPGATATDLTVLPLDTTILSTQTAPFRVEATDAQGQPVTSLLVSWSVRDQAAGTVSDAGVFTPSQLRGSTWVIARLPNDVRDSARVTFKAPATQLAVVSGNAQTGPAGAALEQAIVVEARAADNVPVPGVAVAFAVTSGGGSVTPTSAVTDANGRASTSLTLGTTAGTNTVTASSEGLPSVSATATATAAAPGQLELATAPSTEARAGIPLAQQPAVQVRDQFGNAITTTGLEISATVLGDGQTLGGTTTATTDNTGRATFSNLDIRGLAGTIQLRFALGTGDVAVTSGNITLGAGPARALAITQQPSATATSGSPLAVQPRIQLRDGFGNAVAAAGVPVTAALEVADGRTLGGTTTVNTLATGVAEYGDLVITGPAGTARLMFSGADSLTAAVSGDIVVGVAAPATVTLVSGDGQSAPAGSTLSQPFVVEVRAADNAVVAGHPVTFAVTAGGGSVNPTTATTGADGRASTTLTLGTAAGTNTVQITADGIAPISVSATGTAIAATTRRWIAGVDGPWETAANWSGGAVPGAQDTVLLDQAGTYVVYLTTAASVAKVVVGASTGQQSLLVAAPGSLAITDSLVVADSGVFHMSGASATTILSAGAITIRGVAQWLGGDIAGTGDVEVMPDAVLSIGGSTPMTLSNRLLRNRGALLLGGDATGNLVLADGASIENLAGAEIDVSGEGDILQGNGAGGSIVNQGLYRKLPGNTGVHTIGVVFMNEAPFEVYEGTVAFTNPSVQNRPDGVMRGLGAVDATGTVFDNLGTIDPGLTPGMLTFVGPVNLQATTNLNIELGGTTAGTQYDVVDFTGTVTVGGAVTVTLIDGYQPAQGDSLTVVRYPEGAHTGTFANIFLPTLGGGLYFDPVYTATGLSLVVRQSAAPNVSWVNAAGGDWSVGANWSTGTPPTATDNVAIDLAGTYTITVGTDVTVAGLTLGAATGVQTLSVANSNLIVEGPTTISPTGVLSLSNSSVVGPGTVTNNGTVTLLSSSFGATVALQNQGLLRTHGASSVFGTLATTAASVIRPQGQASGGTGALSISEGFVNNGAIELTSVGGYNSSLTVVTGTLTNAAGGTIRSLTGGGSRTLAAQLDNQGTVEVLQLLTLNRADAQHLNSGTINLAAANLTVTQTVGTGTPSFTNAGTVTLGANIEWTVTGGALDLTGGTVSGPVSATLIVSNATLAFAPADVGALPLTLTNTAIAGGSVTVGTGETLTLLGGGLADPVTLDGGMLMAHGAVALSGAVAVLPGSVLRAQGQANGGTGAITVANGFTNNGTIELISVGGYNSSLAVTAGELLNAAGASIRSLTGGGSRTLAAQLNNQGTLEVLQLLTINRVDAQHSNTGTIDLTAANLTVTQTVGTGTPSFTNTGGTVIMAGARDWTVTGGTLTLTGGTVTSTTPATANLIVSNATLAFAQPNIGLIPLTLTNTAIAGGSVTIGASETLVLLGGGIADPVTIQSGGTLLTHGAVALNGTLTMPTGAMLRAQGQANGGTAALTVANGFVNNGTIELFSVGGYNSSLAVTNGTLTNSGGGLIRSLTGGGSRTLAAALDNQGTVEVLQLLTLNRVDAQHLNTGTIDLTAANLTVTQTVGTGTPSFANAGTVTLGPNIEWTVNGGTLDLTGSIVTGPASATLIVNNATLAFAPADVGTLPLTLTNVAIAGGSVTILSPQTLVLLDGGLNDPVTIEAGGTLLTHGAVALNGALTMPTGSTLRPQGQANGGTAALTVANGFANNGTIDLFSVGGYNASLTVTSGELLNNAGAIIRSSTGGGSRTLAAQLNNQGTVEVLQLLSINRTGAQHVNAGTIDLTAADLSVTHSGAGTPGFTNTGAITLGANRMFTVNLGTLDIAQGTVFGPASATLVVNNATLAFTPASVGTLPVTLNNTVIAGGLVSIENAQTLILLGGGLTDPVTVQSGGTLVTHGAVALNGALTLPTGSTLRLQGQANGGTAALTVANGFANNGTIELLSVGGYSATLAVTSGELLNNASGVIRSSTGGGSRTLAAQLNNQGTVDVLQLLTLNRAGAQHINAGTFDLTSANLTVTQTGTTPSFTNTGTVIMEGTRDWTVTGGTLDLTGGTVTSTTPAAANLIVSNATLAFAQPNVGLIPLTLTNTSIPGGVTLGDAQTLVLLGGGISDAVTINAGGMLRAHGAVSLGGALAIVNGTLEAYGQANGGTGAITVANGFTNNGTINLVSSGGYNSSLTVTNGTLINGVEATLASLPGGGSRTLNAQLDNRGFLEIQQALSVTRADAQHVNQGVILLNAGTGNLTFNQSGTTPSFTNSNTITLGAGRTMFVTAGPVLNTGSGLIEGAGNLDVTGATFTNDAQMQPGGPLAASALTVTGNLTQAAANGSMSVELGGTAIAQYDRLNVTGAATLAGSLNVSLINGFQLAAGQTFQVMNYQSATGTVLIVPPPGLPAGWQLVPTYNATNLTLTVVAP